MKRADKRSRKDKEEEPTYTTVLLVTLCLILHFWFSKVGRCSLRVHKIREVYIE